MLEANRHALEKATHKLRRAAGAQIRIIRKYNSTKEMLSGVGEDLTGAQKIKAVGLIDSSISAINSAAQEINAIYQSKTVVQEEEAGELEK